MFVDTTSRTASEAVNLHEVSRDFLDGVVYSAIVPQESVKGIIYTHMCMFRVLCDYFFWSTIRSVYQKLYSLEKYVLLL